MGLQWVGDDKTYSHATRCAPDPSRYAFIRSLSWEMQLLCMVFLSKEGQGLSRSAHARERYGLSVTSLLLA